LHVFKIKLSLDGAKKQHRQCFVQYCFSNVSEVNLSCQCAEFNVMNIILMLQLYYSLILLLKNNIFPYNQNKGGVWGYWRKYQTVSCINALLTKELLAWLFRR